MLPILFAVLCAIVAIRHANGKGLHVTVPNSPKLASYCVGNLPKHCDAILASMKNGTLHQHVSRANLDHSLHNLARRASGSLSIDLSLQLARGLLAYGADPCYRQDNLFPHATPLDVYRTLASNTWWRSPDPRMENILQCR
jgi:hypothetical protein